MKEVTVKTIWMGRVGVPEHLVNLNEGLRIVVGRDTMTIRQYDVEDKILGHSAWLRDRYGKADYRLVYFEWNPDCEQGVLV